MVYGVAPGDATSFAAALPLDDVGDGCCGVGSHAARRVGGLEFSLQAAVIQCRLKPELRTHCIGPQDFVILHSQIFSLRDTETSLCLLWGQIEVWSIHGRDAPQLRPPAALPRPPRVSQVR